MGVALPVLLGSPLSGCSGEEDVDASALCDDVAQVVAQRTVACTADVDLGNRRYERFRTAFPCKTAPLQADTQDPRYSCAQSIQALDCKGVAARGDNVGAWYTDHGCSLVFDLSGAGGAGGAAGAGGQAGGAP
jgi:hypothetical protein